MEKMRVGQVEVDHCARCGALWFDPYELEAVITAKGGTLGIDGIDYGDAGHRYDSHAFNANVRSCPRDGATLRVIPDPRQPHIELDACPTCRGVLLDAGELKDLSEFTLGERMKAFFRR